MNSDQANINEAKRKLKLSEFTSDLEIPAEETSTKRPIKRTKRLVSDSSCSEEENERAFVRPPKLKKKNFAKVAEKLAITDSTKETHVLQEDLNLVHVQSSVSNPIGVRQESDLDQTNCQSTNCQVEYKDLSDLPSGLLQDLEVELGLGEQLQFEVTDTAQQITPSSTNLTEYQSKVIGLLATLKTQNNQILEILKQNHKETTRGTLPNLFKFPLRTIDQLNANEELLKNKHHYHNLVSYLKTFGGQDGSAKVRRTLKYLISDSLACEYNFYGQNRVSQKQPFNKLILRECIVETVITTTTSTVKEIEDNIKSWLKHAPERQKKTHKR